MSYFFRPYPFSSHTFASLSCRILSVSLAVLLMGASVLGNVPALADSGPSILRPNSGITVEFRFPVSSIDPSAATNPKGAIIPGFRAENQLIIYTPAYGNATGTNDAGFEAVVTNGAISRTSYSGNDDIPVDGFVISGHGTAAQWMAKFAKPGALATVDLENGRLIIRFTPAVYLHETDVAIQQAESRPPANAEHYQRFMTQAKACRAQLAGLANQPVSSEMAALAEQCRLDANRAFYNTVESKAGEFRGVWIRPAGTNPEQIRKVIAGLKEAHISNVFLETYFQGKTAYPSRVMTVYGLQAQHPQYNGGDPVRLWIDEAHQAGLKVHLWAQVFFAGNQRENMEQYGPILQKYPEWRNVQRPNWNVKAPVISEIEPGHYFLDPANPEVRTFLNKLLMEMVTTYDADGLNLDYIRYPASAAVNKGYYLGTTWGYTESARKQFQDMISQERQAAETKRIEALKAARKPASVIKAAAASKEPPADPKDLSLKDPLWPRWVAWRKEQVSSFVKSISQQARAAKPNLLMSAVIFPSSDSTYAQKLQDYPRWANEGDIQALTPIGLSTLPEKMSQQCGYLRQQVQDKIPVYIGIFGLYNRNSPVELVRQIDTVHQAGMPGVVLFDWSRINATYEEALLEGPFRE